VRDRILVTGGAGYIGSQTCKLLAECGYEPITYDSLVTGNRWAVRWGPFEHGDIADRERLLDVLSRYRPAAIIHFAAFAYVGESMMNPSKYYRNNVAGTLSLLECARLADVTRIVFSSTCATYGVPEALPIPESAPQAPINPYGRSKLMIEQILRDFCSAHDFSGVALRYFNAAGADPDNEIGEHHDPETHLIPLALEAARNPSQPIRVFGDDYPTQDGTCIRDYIHVSDLAAAHVLAVENGLVQGKLNAFNLGTGVGLSVKQIIQAVGRVTNREVPVVFGERRPGDPAALVATADRARSKLGWQPQHSSIDTIVGTAWAWITR
jgi:UDP-arabinose 4-epimerase